jgi:uncharacterized repeat protein (TIGR01451 family)
MRRRTISAITTALFSLALIATVWPCVAGAERPAGVRTAAASRPAPHGPHAASATAVAMDPAAMLRSGRAQAVRFDLPPGAAVEIATRSGVIPVDPELRLALAVGPTYRLRVTYHTDKLDATLYPTIRLIGYTMPPAHVDPVAFPVPIRFESRDLDDAAEGRHLSNVVYLEDPILALPLAYPRGDMPVHDVAPGEDALFKASMLGRPIVFMQLGDRVLLDDQFDTGKDDPPALVLPASIAAATDAIPGEIQPAGVAATVPGALVGALARPGMPTHGVPAPQCTGCPTGAAAARPSVPLCCNKHNMIRQPYKRHPRMPFDEFLCDGGDAIPYVHFDADAVLTGLEPGETVAQFSRPGDRPRVSVANQACVYAPRFGLMRSSIASLAGFQVDTPLGVAHEQNRAAMESRVALDERTQASKVRGLRQRARPSSLLMRENVVGIEELRILDAVHQQEGSDNVFGRIGAIRLSRADELRLKMGIDAALVWNRAQYPAYTALTSSGGQITGSMRTGEVEKFDEPHRRPGELILTKVATPQQAQQGDIVEFAIYYYNIGERPIEAISIIDSLTPRLEYVPNSARTDRRAVFTARPNDVESRELRWDISDPLAGGETGVVWFQAEVR